jgi:lipopolysaccharide biosynthesis protein
MQKPKVIAIFLPQFHPIPENDDWWGKGFTEWTNVTKAKPLFEGHAQPRLPTDLGFYDLRLMDTLRAQFELAQSNGIYGFSFYHYWFHGKRLLHKPVDSLCGDPTLSLPFCLFWANESWSRRWLGEEKEILIKQEHSAADDAAHARYLCSVFEDPRYIRVGDRPLFTIYRPTFLSEPVATVERIKECFYAKHKIEPFLVASNSHHPVTKDLLALGFDAVLNFRPQLGVLPDAFVDGFSAERLSQNVKAHGIYSGTLKIYEYAEALRLMEAQEDMTFDKVIPSVFVGWDNTPRRGEAGIIMIKSSPEIFKTELLRNVEKLNRAESPAKLIFINAWNEWAEGNYLEPDNWSKNEFLRVVESIFGFGGLK